jgi:hypothetical protein
MKPCECQTQYEHTSAREAQLHALESLNAAILAIVDCEESARCEAEHVQDRIKAGYQFTDAELTDYLHQAAIDFDVNVRSTLPKRMREAREALAELSKGGAL